VSSPAQGGLLTRKALGALVFVAYLVWNLVAWYFTEPQDSYDTYRYFQPLSEPLNPGIVVNSIYLTLESNTLITLAQVLLATAAWIFFSVAVLVRLNWRTAGWVMAAVTLLFSLTQPIWSWHMLTYSESLTNTTLVFWLGSIAWLAARSPFALKSLIPISIAASLIALTRPQLLIFVLPTQLVILTWWWRTNRRALPALGAAVSILPFMAFAVYRVQLVTEISLFKMRYALNNLVGKNDSFREYALAEMPPCDLVPQALNGPAPWNDTQALGDPMINACPETWIWFRSDAVNMQQWMLSRPSATLAEFATQVNNVVLPLAPQGMAMPTFLSQLLLNVNAPLIWAVGYLVAGIFFAFLVGARPKVTPLAVIGLTAIALSVFMHLLFVWGADGDSVERHLFPTIPMIAIALLVFPSVWPKRTHVLPFQQGSFNRN
jgi:hypothetical protein